MRAIPIGLLLIVLAAVACSDRVPAPVTPTPSPRPGYPPVPASELPEGVLYVQKPGTTGSPLFAIAPEEEARQSVTSSWALVAPGGTHAAAVSLQGGVLIGIGVLTGSRYEKVADGPWATGSPMFLWSSDGRRLAYTVPENEQPAVKSRVWTLDMENGEKMLLTAEADFYALLGWTAANEVLVRTEGGLALVGKGVRSIELPEAGEVVDIEASPDGRAVAVKVGAYEHDDESELTFIHTSGIWILDLTGEGWREIVGLADEPPEVMTTGGQEMRWSPDGARITIHRTRIDERGIVTDGLSVLDVRTGEERLVHEQGWGWESWSPDGRYLAFMYHGNAELGQSGKRLGLLGPDGRNREAEGSPRGIAWAGDGHLLLDIPGRLSTLDPETMRVEEVLTADGEAISVFLDSSVWSPSGRYLAAPTASDAYHRSSLYIVDTETGTGALFLDGPGFSAVAWVRE